jgi:AcrR family transcriptional regulator
VNAAEAILDATGRSVVANGFGATSLEAISKDAGLSRATMYRTFPGGRSEVLDTFVRRELDRFFADLYEHVRHLTSLEEVLTEGLWYARRRILVHPFLNLALVEDSRVLGPALALANSSLLGAISEFYQPFLADDPFAASRSHFLARLTLSYLAVPGTWDFASRDQVRELVQCELTPEVTVQTSPPLPPVPLPPWRPQTLQEKVSAALMAEFVAGGTISMESVAQRAEVSRATLYRAFPGGRPSLVRLVFATEISRVLAAVAVGVAQSATLDEASLSFLTTTWHHLAHHDGIRTLVSVNPDFIADRLRFAKGQRTLDELTGQLAPLFARWVGARPARRIAELLLRVLFSYWLEASEDVKWEDPASVAAFYDRHIAPGVAALADRPNL